MLPLFFYFHHWLKNLSFSVKGNVEGFASSPLLCGVEFKVLIVMKALFIINHDTTDV
jgi:hypothetical protein